MRELQPPSLLAVASNNKESQAHMFSYEFCETLKSFTNTIQDRYNNAYINRTENFRLVRQNVRLVKLIKLQKRPPLSDGLNNILGLAFKRFSKGIQK